ncbi:cell division protein FtsQ [Microbacteriaceae bacterium SG_E_30_P1]|uniref:Cell division protein FtsQ n=1 Tax=Antiquaquibacter oligotrophicus TaxID=2880260 RepID=A0ABT6KP13_9MICO|nr:FtsQ-type POTRA domain-containing protein [Antiquaquibacter oligotrophicus]MDH6180822.1 cell division protein FtsQ [Antiquaquibacter oligotrophicus]UDF13462.1 FtsQ-type POTRA domain-containing protein [Antiquaquibacter oligotrophicus]
MKRPEGFDASRPEPARPAKPARSPKSRGAAPHAAPKAAQKTTPEPRVTSPRTKPQRDASVITPTTQRLPRASRSVRPDAAARAELRRAARDRRKAERAEVRRFTRRSRNRKIGLIAAGGVVVTLAGLVVTAVFSPLLALREIRVEGASRVNPADIVAALDDQLGTPLALLDTGTIERELSAFPLVRSYITQTIPPGTLVVTLSERQPAAVISTGSGFALVDPAGVVLQESTERIAGVPLVDLGGADARSPRFRAAVDVLLALPPDLLARVDSVTAHTQDDVSLVLSGVGQRVAWGAADDSARKAALLEALISVTDPNQAGEFDVSAPTNGVFRPA